ncbi:MAG: hypothetical protein ACM37W_25520 [Actinomycetota bacterium]
MGVWVLRERSRFSGEMGGKKAIAGTLEQPSLLSQSTSNITAIPCGILRVAGHNFWGVYNQTVLLEAILAQIPLLWTPYEQTGTSKSSAVAESNLVSGRTDIEPPANQTSPLSGLERV